MKTSTVTVLVAIGALLAGGAVTAAFMVGQEAKPGSVESAIVPPVELPPAQDIAGDVAETDTSIPGPVLEYAEVITVTPVVSREKLYATVIGTEPVRETTRTATPREVCEDVVVEERLPERDGNVGGTVAGAVIGGLVGNQVGKGNGRKAATAAGAVAGGVIGNRIDKNHQGGQVVARTERQCHTEEAVSESTRVTGYNVTYRNPDGTTGTMRMDTDPGTRIALGTTDKVLGYDVTYRFDGTQGTIRMDEKPGERLPVIDGQVVTRTVAAGGNPQG